MIKIKVDGEIAENDYKIWAEEQVKEGVAMIYNYPKNGIAKTWEQCYKEFAEKQVIRHNKLWRKFLDLQEALHSKQGWNDEDLADFANMLSMQESGTKYEGNTMHRLIQEYKQSKGEIL